MKLSNITHVNEQKMSIGGGLSALETILLVPNSVYFIGASTSPDHIVVTKVSDDEVDYVTTHNMKKARLDFDIASDLIARGTKTWIDSYKSNFPKLAKSLSNNLAGKKGSENGKAKAADYIKYEVKVRSMQKEPVTGRNNDPWYELEQYGSVGMMDDGTYTVSTTAKELRDIKKNKNFTVLSAVKQKATK